MYAKENPVFSTFLQLLPPLYLFKLNSNILQNILFQNNVLPQGFTRDKLKYIIVIYYINSFSSTFCFHPYHYKMYFGIYGGITWSLTL